MIDDLRQIAIFAKAVDHGSFRAAAAALRLSPSVVSHHIAQLEEKLGVPLIYRSTRRLTLTREGDRLLASAHAMLDAVESGLNDLRGKSGRLHGTLRITLPLVLAHARLLNDIALFASVHPELRLLLECTDERKNLVRDGYDLGIRMGPQRKRGSSRRRLFKAGRVLVVSREYLTSCGAITVPEDLRACQWIEFSPARHVTTRLHKEGEAAVELRPKPQISANSAFAVFQLVKAGAGIAILPDFLAEGEDSVMTLEDCLPGWHLEPLEVYAEWPANAPQNGAARMLVNHLLRTHG